MRLTSFASVAALVALASGIGCSTLSGLSELEVTDRECVKDCPDTGVADTQAPADTAPETSPDVGVGTLELEPAEVVLFADTSTTPATEATQTFKATLRAPDGSTRDVSGEATFTLEDAAVGSFAGAKFTSAASTKVASTTTVKATISGVEATALLSVVRMRKGVDTFVTAPKDAPAEPAKTVLVSNSKIGRIDLAIVMDTTGSMANAIANVKANLEATLFPNISKLIPDAAIAIADHRDYPVSPYGDTADWPVKILQPVTTDISAAKTAAALLTNGGGNDGPEAQIPAMQHVLTGEGLAWTGGSLAPHKPAPDTSGAVDFRANALKVVVLVTDVDWHGEGHTPYSGFVTPTMATLKIAFGKAAAKFVDITNGNRPFIGGVAPEDQANELSDATGSTVAPEAFGSGACGAGQCCTGIDGAARPPVAGKCRLNFLHNNGGGVSEAIVNAVRAMSNGLTFSGGIGAFADNDPANPDGVDVSKMLTVRAMNEGTAECIARSAKDTNADSVLETFNGPIRVDNKICFELSVANTTVDPKPTPQFFVGYVDVLASPGAVRLERRAVVVMVPKS